MKDFAISFTDGISVFLRKAPCLRAGLCFVLGFDVVWEVGAFLFGAFPDGEEILGSLGELGVFAPGGGGFSFG